MRGKRVISMLLALSATVGCASVMSACTTAYPKVEMEISFNGETYELEYKLHRNVAPATVEHFLTLAENKFYDGLCVHDYANMRLYTGAYSFNSEEEKNGGLVYNNYYDKVKNYNLPQTVFVGDKTTYTLYGEFEANSFSVESGALKENFGTLSMYYTTKDKGDKVTIKHPEAGQSNGRDYMYNSATSMFFISLTASEKTVSNYCTFATLDEDSVDVLKNLQADIDAYCDANEGGVEKVSVRVDEDDIFVGESHKTEVYSILQKAVVIKSVKVTKY